MDKYFSIGDISKLSNLSVQTLRHYDKLGLLKPSLKKDNGYRYYSLEQLYKLDLIVFYRKLWLSLVEINNIVSTKTNIQNTLDLLQNQEHEIGNKIRELKKQKSIIRKKKLYIQSMINKPLATVFLEEKSKMKIAKINIDNKDLSNAEISFRKKLNEQFDMIKNVLNLELIYEIDFNNFNNRSEEKYNICFCISDEKIEENENIKICELQEGLYASILYIDYYDCYDKYLRQLVSFLETQNLKIDGKLYEKYIASEFVDGKERGFMELFVKVSK